MSSSSDIEKLFDHFGGDANAYQEIGRENEARSARTRWPLLVTLDLTQPTIPAIGQRREAQAQSPAVQTPVAIDRQDTTPKDAASVTRAKAPLFTRSHRRDIPPVAVAAPASAPSGASRFGEPEVRDLPVPATASGAAKGEVATPAPAPAAAPTVAAAAPAQFAPIVAPAQAALAAPTALLSRVPVAQTIPSASASWAQAPAPVRAYAAAPAATSAPTAPFAPAALTQPTQPASILGKLFSPERASQARQPVVSTGESAPLQSVFDRLRGTPARAAAAPAGATPATPHSWLTTGPRRS